jgi:TolB-like protein
LDVGVKNETKTNEVKEKKSPQTEAPTKTNLNIYTITGGVLSIIGIIFWFFFSTSSLSTADEGLIENSIAIFSFDNLSTEEETYRIGEILQHLIISDLSGLTHLKVISHQRLKDIQKQSSDDVENYTIAQQANAKVLLSGSIMDLSGKKILVGELIDAIDGNVITSHRIEGEDIYLMVDKLTDNIHKALDISEHSEDYIELQAGTKTTQSLDAYEKYLEGLSYLNDLDYEKANNNFQDAVKIDSTFFDAHYLSAIAMWWMDESETNEEASKYCKKLIDNKLYFDDIQKLKAEGASYIISGNYKEALPIYEKIIKLKPDDKTGWYMYGEANYHIDKGNDDEEADKYWDAADKAFNKALDLDPNFGVARTHIIGMLLLTHKFSEVINEEIEKIKKHPNNATSYSNIILAYEILEDSSNAAKYLNNAKSNFEPSKICYMMIQIGSTLGLSVNKLNYYNQNNYHLRRATYYMQNCQNFCSDDWFNSDFGGKLAIVMAYRAYDILYAKSLYNKITKDFSDIEKIEFAHRVSEANLWQNMQRQFPNESKKYRNKLSYYFSMKVLEYSKKLNEKMYFSKALRLLLITHPDNDNPEKIESFYRREINSLCGSKSTVGCLDFGKNSSGVLADLAAVLYQIDLYDDAKNIYQHVIDKINLLVDFNDPDSDPAKASIHNIHFLLGLINLKMNNLYLARQNFVSGSTALRENKSLIEEHVNWNWLTDKYFKFRIAECLYKENHFANAIKYFNEAYILEDRYKEKMKYISMKALCEYYNNDLDSSKYHFNIIENYIKNDKTEYDGDGSDSYYLDWPLYKYYNAKGNTEKATQYLMSAYNHISMEEKNKFLLDNDRLNNIHKYYYIHEIIDEYNQHIR